LAHLWSDGKLVFDCGNCGNQKLLGCGWEPEYLGRSKLAQSDNRHKVDYGKTCPGWWARQPFPLEINQFLNWKANLGNPLDLPYRLWQGISLYESFSAENT